MDHKDTDPSILTQVPSHEGQLVEKQIAGGVIQIVQQEDVIKARGVRYGQAKRFEPSIKPDSWTEIQDCTKPRGVCPQLPSRLDVVIGDTLINRYMDEDCLFLSVMAPVVSDQNLPVMVWFHGGAYITGGGDLEPYNPHELVRRGVIVVNVNYRLGIFGAMGIPGIAPANLGLRDQILALHWVQENISYFGGDPTNVTLFGQSAGADSVYCIMVSDGTEQLYRRAILQSAPWSQRMPGCNESIQKDLPKIAQKAIGLHADTMSVDELLKLQAELLRLGEIMHVGLMKFLPQFGVYPLPHQTEIDERLNVLAQTKPLMVGWVKHEYRPFLMFRPNYQSLRKVPLLGTWLFNLVTWYWSKDVFISGAQQFHAHYLKRGGSSTSYSWEYFVKGNPFKASHCIELAFLLGRWSYWSKTPVLEGIDKNVYVRLATALRDTWVAFATGVPFPKKHIRINESFKPNL